MQAIYHRNSPVHAISLILIGVGSCIFMMVAVTLSPLVITEPHKIAGNVMLGMLLLGIIIVLKNKISAGSILSVSLIWICGAIGLAIGSGLFLEGIMTALLTYILLKLFSKYIQTD